MSTFLGSNLRVNKNQLLQARAQNLTTAQITALAATLSAGDKGLFVYDTDLLKLFIWDGTTFVDQMPPAPQIGQYRGGVLHTDAEPINLVSGDWVVFTSAGVVTNFGGTQTVQVGDWAIYNGTTWDILQGNVDLATETTVGLTQLATSAEAIAGTNATKAVTPQGLQAKINDNENSRKFIERRTLTANVPVEITHNFNSSVKATFLLADPATYEEVSLFYEEVNGNTTRVLSNIDIVVDVYLFKLN